ncbi:hypothetical protein RB653_007533 [Dictyostelium firmibasis]|uniref:Uncharacterized protein n=1 Tax=Dictyostelium firmibasis TaxID=79012 RepID=A0AAN7YP42_9MYCE
MNQVGAKNLSTIFGTLVKRKSKGENLLDVCFSLPNRGVGNKFAKKGWTEKDTYWTITKTKFGEITCTNSALRGQAYGILTWGGKTETQERPIKDVYSKDWSIFPSLKYPILAAEPVVEAVEAGVEAPTEEIQAEQQN